MFSVVRGDDDDRVLETRIPPERCDQVAHDAAQVGDLSVVEIGQNREVFPGMGLADVVLVGPLAPEAQGMAEIDTGSDEALEIRRRWRQRNVRLDVVDEPKERSIFRTAAEKAGELAVVDMGAGVRGIGFPRRRSWNLSPGVDEVVEALVRLIRELTWAFAEAPQVR